MSIRAVLAVGAVLVAGQAVASSILHIDGDGAQASRSIMTVEQDRRGSSIHVVPADRVVRISRSVIAIGDPAVGDERVAAINDGSATTVLRGGVVGDALPAPVAEVVPEKKLSRPAQRKKERDERRAIREAQRLGLPLPQKAATQDPADQPSGS